MKQILEPKWALAFERGHTTIRHILRMRTRVSIRRVYRVKSLRAPEDEFLEPPTKEDLYPLLHHHSDYGFGHVTRD